MKTRIKEQHQEQATDQGIKVTMEVIQGMDLEVIQTMDLGVMQAMDREILRKMELILIQ